MTDTFEISHRLRLKTGDVSETGPVFAFRPFGFSKPEIMDTVQISISSVTVHNRLLECTTVYYSAQPSITVHNRQTYLKVSLGHLSKLH